MLERLKVIFNAVHGGVGNFGIACQDRQTRYLRTCEIQAFPIQKSSRLVPNFPALEHGKTTTIEASCAWQLSTAPTRTPSGQCGSNRLTCTLNEETTARTSRQPYFYPCSKNTCTRC